MIAMALSFLGGPLGRIAIAAALAAGLAWYAYGRGYSSGVADQAVETAAVQAKYDAYALAVIADAARANAKAAASLLESQAESIRLQSLLTAAELARNAANQARRRALENATDATLLAPSVLSFLASVRDEQRAAAPVSSNPTRVPLNLAPALVRGRTASLGWDFDGYRFSFALRRYAEGGGFVPGQFEGAQSFGR